MALGDASTANPRNAALERLASPLIGRWKLTLTDAWFLDPGTIQHGEATFEWLGDSFLTMTGLMEGEPTWNYVFGYSDPNEKYVALYHDPRGTARVFDVTLDGRELVMLREDSDFHQRWTMTIGPDRIESHPDASEDLGKTWRKDFDLTFDRMH